MPDDDHGAINHSFEDSLIHAVSDSASTEEDGDWSTPLWDDNWQGDIVDIGEVRLFLATKKWPDGTVDVLTAHYPEAEDDIPTAYAHRHGKDVTPFTVHGPADKVVQTVTCTWEPPQERQTSWDS